MEQGNRSDSTVVSARQIEPHEIPDAGRDARVAGLLTAAPLGSDQAAVAFATVVTRQTSAATTAALADFGLTSEVSEEICSAIEDHAEAIAAGRAETVDSDEIFNRHVARQEATDEALRSTPVRTLADLRAKLTYLVPVIAPDMLDSTHVAHLEAIVGDMDRLCREHLSPDLICNDRPLPTPGSEEAKAAFQAACHEQTLTTQFANGYPDLKRTPLEWWTKDTLGKAMEAGEITPAECARLYPRASERELRIEIINHRLNLGALHALAFADDYAEHTAERLPEPTDFTAYTPRQLAHAYDALSAIWHHVSISTNAPFCWDAERKNHNIVGRLLDAEADRIEDMIDGISRVAASRASMNDDERDERLETILRHELICEGRIRSPGLLAEINAAWGA